MVSAIVLLNTEMGTEEGVLEQLKNVSGVQTVRALYGVYDIAAEVNAESIDKLKAIITGKIRPIRQALNILTLLTVEETEPQKVACDSQQQLRDALFLAGRNARLDDS